MDHDLTQSKLILSVPSYLQCKGAGVDPHLYMFPNVPYVFVENESALTLRRTWYVMLTHEATHHANWHTKFNCRVHRDAVDMVRGKSWHLKSFVPTPEQGLPPFVLKHIDWGIQSRTDMSDVFLTDSPIVFSRDFNHSRFLSLLLHSPQSSKRFNRARTRSFLPTPRLNKQSKRARTRSLLPTPQSSKQNNPASPIHPEFARNFKSELPPSYEDVIKKSRKLTTIELQIST